MTCTPRASTPRLGPTLAVLAVGVLTPMLLAQPPGWRPNPQPFGSGMPNNPNPVNPQPIGSGMPNFAPAPVFVTVWSCDSCGRELGRGPVPPALSNCPYCGVRLVGVKYGGNNMPNVPPAAMPNIPAFTPAPMPSSSMPFTSPGGSGYSPPSSGSPFPGPSTAGVGTVLVGVVIVVVGLVVLGGAGCLIVFGMAKNGARSRRRRLRFDDED